MNAFNSALFVPTQKFGVKGSCFIEEALIPQHYDPMGHPGINISQKRFLKIFLKSLDVVVIHNEYSFLNF
ncbi:hypothetical protein [Synechococcus sp. MIT S1220]|uniref:hypothetical protein n=1 Tax=Synechococcus sp. MIT S1220 TaxID=3082549 RepID=UPI0039B080E0